MPYAFRCSAGFRLSALLLVVPALASLAGAADVPVRVNAKPTCAVIAPPEGGLAESPVVPLLEARLGQAEGVTLLERQEVARILAEQRLQALAAPENVRGRVALGKLLKSDLLVMLAREVPPESPAPAAGAASRPGGPAAASEGGVAAGQSRPPFTLPNAEKPIPAVRIVICETTGGLRLCVRVVAIERDPQATVSALQKAVNWAVEKHRQAITDVIAVPPFVDDELGYDFAYLKSAYARVIEQSLLDRPGMVVVELAEADAIAREFALAGGGPVGRSLPLYLLGHYRHERRQAPAAGAGQPAPVVRVNLSLSLNRGREPLASSKKDDVAADAPAAVVRDEALRLIERVGGRAPAGPGEHDRAADAKALAERAMVFRNLANWPEAEALLEASLLVEPDQLETRRQAAIVLGHIAQGHFRQVGRTAEDVRAGVAEYFRALEHLENFLRTAGDLSAYRDAGQYLFLYELLGVPGSWGAAREEIREIPTVLAEGRVREREVFKRIAIMRARNGRGDDITFALRAVSDLPVKQQYAVLFELLRDLQGLPDGERRVRLYAARGFAPEVMMSEDGRAFLERVAGLNDPVMRAAVESLKAQFPAFAEMAQRREAAARAATAPTSRPASDAAGPAEVVVRPLPAKFRFYSCVPAGDGTDLFWAVNQSKLLLITKKGEPEPVYQLKEPNGGFDSACFDGRYAWAHVSVRGQSEPVLVVVDPHTRKVSTITAADGLPAPAFPPGTNTTFAAHRAAIAPIAPGRVCVAATLGHTWLAIVSFDPDHPDGRKTVNVFHEARAAQDHEPKEQWKDTHVVFEPTFAFTLARTAVPADQGGDIRTDAVPGQQVIIGRKGNNIGVSAHPLMIDPANLSVEPAQCEVFGREKGIVNQSEAFYWAAPGPNRRELTDHSLTVWRFGFPDFVQTPVARHVHEGNESAMRLASYEGRVLLATGIFWSAESFNGPFRPLRGSFTEGEDVRLPDRQFFRSNVYGLLLHTYRGLFQVEFPRATDAPTTNPSPPNRTR